MYQELTCRNEGKGYDRPVVSVGLKARSLYISKLAFTPFRKFDGLIFMLDDEQNKLGLRPASCKEDNAYKIISYGKNRACGRVYCPSVLSKVGWNKKRKSVYSAEWNERVGLLEINLGKLEV